MGNSLKQELEYYDSIHKVLLEEHTEKYVLIKNKQKHGIFSNFEDAHGAALAKFGPQTEVLIQKITQYEEINFHAPIMID